MLIMSKSVVTESFSKLLLIKTTYGSIVLYFTAMNRY